MQQSHCYFCGHPAAYVHVHGHYQCKVCGTNALPCCDGDNCDTNLLLRKEAPLPEKGTGKTAEPMQHTAL